MPQGVTGLFSSGAGAAAPSYAGGAVSRANQENGDAPTSFDDVLDRAAGSGGGSADKASDASNASGTSTKAASKKAAASHTSAKKKAPARDAAQAKPLKTTQQDPTAEAEQNASANAGSQDAGADPNTNDGAAKQEKPDKKGQEVAATATDASTAVVQLQNAPAAKQGGDATPKGKAESPAATKATPASAKQATTPQDPANAQSTTTNASAQQPADAPAAPTDGQPDPATDSDDSAPPGKVRLAIQPKDATGEGEVDPSQAAAAAAAAQQPAGQPAAADLAPTDGPTASAAVASTTAAASPAPRSSGKSPEDLLLQALGGAQQSAQPGASHPTPNAGTSSDATPVSPTAQFAQANHPNVVSGITGRLLPGGGSMQIRLDPPELGAMQVRVEMRDGVMTASFETSTDQAAKLLSHSLGDLKTALEAQGVSVERLHVSQMPKQQQSPGGNDPKGDSQPRQDSAAQQEQQRREMMQRMWRRLMKGQDPLDLVA